MELERKSTRRQTGPLGGWREHAKGLATVLIRRWQTIPLLIGMVAGGAMISGAIGFFLDARHNTTAVQGLSAPSTGTVESAWWRLDFSPKELDGASNWAIYVDPAFCVRTRQVSGQQAVACQRYQRILDIFDSPYQLQNLGGEAEGLWRNEAGGLSMAFHMPLPGWRYLNQTASPYQDYQAPWRPYAGVAPDGEASYWDMFRTEFEQPAEHLLRLYQQPATISLATDPADPARAAPSFFLQQGAETDIAPMVAAVAAFGAVFWGMSFNMLLAGWARALRTALVALSLVSAPWWGSWMWRGMDLMMQDASGIGQMLQLTFVPRPPKLEILPPDYQGEPGDHVAWYSLSTSLYAPAFEGITLQPPSEAMSQADAMALIKEQVDRSLARMSEAQRTRHFEKLACLSSNGYRGAGKLFLASAEGWLDDPASGQMAQKFVDYQNNSGIQFNNLRCDF